MIEQQKEYLIKSFIRMLERCQQDYIPMGKVLLQMKADLNYEGDVLVYLQSLEPGQLSPDLVGKLSWWKDHLGLLLRTTQEKRRKRREYLERVSRANERAYEQEVEAIVFSKNPYEE